MSLVVTDPYRIPVSDADLTITSFNFSTSARIVSAFSIASLFSLSKSAFVFSKSSLFSLVALRALPEGIRKFLPKPGFTTTASPIFPSLLIF